MTASGAMPTVGAATPRQRRRLILVALLRAFLAAAVLVALYYVLPMDRALDTHTVLLLVLCLAVLAALITWRVRAIMESQYPGLRALETVAAVVPLYILAFATTYFLAERANGAYFSQPLTRSSALYFSMTVFSTVGFGDITAKADPARLIVTAQMFFDLILLGFGARVFLSAVQLGRQRRAPDQPERQES
jgi:voltage-gated potassium channel